MKYRLDFVTNSSSTAYILMIKEEIPEENKWQLIKIDKDMSIDNMLNVFSVFGSDGGLLEYNEEVKTFLESVNVETRWNFLKIFVRDDLLQKIRENDNIYYTIVDRDYPLFFEDYEGEILAEETDL